MKTSYWRIGIRPDGGYVVHNPARPGEEHEFETVEFAIAARRRFSALESSANEQPRRVADRPQFVTTSGSVIGIRSMLHFRWMRRVLGIGVSHNLGSNPGMTLTCRAVGAAGSPDAAAEFTLYMLLLGALLAPFGSLWNLAFIILLVMPIVSLRDALVAEFGPIFD